MKFLLKKYKFLIAVLFIPYCFIYVLCLTPTNKEITLTGDISPVNSLIKIDNEYIQKGSFNSIYVINYDKPTIFQTLLLKNSTVNEVSIKPESYSHFTSSQMNKMGKIQHNQAVESSLIVAYENAKKQDDKINLEYKFLGAIVRYYTKEVNGFEIGDIIFNINGIDATTNPNEFKEAFSSRQINDTFKVKRPKSSIFQTDEVLEFKFDEVSLKKIYFYSKYEIDYAKSYPTLKVNSTATQGPSGGLLQTLSNFNALTAKDYSFGKRIAGTGTIDVYGNVGVIGGITQKIHTAYKKKVDIFFCPVANYDEALVAYNKLKNKKRMSLVKVETFEEALRYLESCQ